MAVLLELSIFSIHGEISKREEVAKVLRAWEQSGIKAHLNAMGSVVEAKDMQEALRAIEIANSCMDCRRYYAIAKFDCYPEREKMLGGRVERVLEEV
ncbi:thiamine-binding protein [Helicobacter kayseriensis]|uniref:thiamine-binding protein n=1 Tax=Helicobacter kayseriensis TaxID=2905877 RepID=UPI001E472D98|nr:thiamine-binding protein [Helicobacter kayseriensis]MCE3046817.1 thiamine-binding protein [Helicobacter kayseriensis]MCE3047881.1 thiamine-binding protein [Helicobacter kayseriensis]